MIDAVAFARRPTRFRYVIVAVAMPAAVLSYVERVWYFGNFNPKRRRGNRLARDREFLPRSRFGLVSQLCAIRLSFPVRTVFRIRIFTRRIPAFEQLGYLGSFSMPAMNAFTIARCRSESSFSMSLELRPLG